MKRKSHKDNDEGINLSGYLAGLMFIAGLLLGSMIGTVTMLLLAPQSGKKTRRQIRRKGRDLRRQATGAVDDTVAQVRAKAQQVTIGIQEQAEALQQRGQDVVDHQRARWAPVVDAGKTAMNNS
jgi:gas vesicle protein